ncbi:hypothetical protein DCS_05273 [Drechmeria coniospora]|uniref:Uncharacterized protein n=1 Tax=Drechmeria coniospora TaxID=98403 RepID=A0A151GMD9_DRECN|nr:hypothetical protein DCS_05273 [Drechmeria coniospora]KYK58260.1 hypothetical protein DCS_05273 [Drechmeria coniospora]
MRCSTRLRSGPRSDMLPRPASAEESKLSQGHATRIAIGGPSSSSASTLPAGRVPASERPTGGVWQVFEQRSPQVRLAQRTTGQFHPGSPYGAVLVCLFGPLLVTAMDHSRCISIVLLPVRDMAAGQMDHPPSPLQSYILQFCDDDVVDGLN